jgi:hypothetical protein
MLPAESMIHDEEIVEGHRGDLDGTGHAPNLR